MPSYESPTKLLTAVTDCRNLVALQTGAEQFSVGDRETAPAFGRDVARRLVSFAAGAVLVVVGVAGLHHLHRGGDSAGDWMVWVAVLLAWLTALGGGIKLATWGLKPVIDAAFDAGKANASEAVRSITAALGIIFGAVGLRWTLRGGYTQWWQSISGEPGWSPTLGVGQMVIAVLAGATLFTGGRYLAGLTSDVLADAGLIRTEDTAAHRNSGGRKDVPSHPVLVVALIAGGLALVAMAVWLTPTLAPTIGGANTLAAAAAISAVLVWGAGANLGWWKGLEGLYAWATTASQKGSAVAGVVAALTFSAGGLGLGWFTPATVPQAHAQCPPDCGGGSNGSNSYGPDASQFQPPQMPNQMPDYQSGMNQPAMDQNGSVSIYNTQAPSVSQSTGGQSAQQGPQQSWDQPAHGTQIPDYQTATPYTQGPGQPNPDYHPNTGSNPGSQGGQANQGAQQPQQAPEQQPSQQNPGQQPNQSSDQQKIDDLTKQLQDQQQQSTQDRQRLDDLTKQLQNQQGQQKSGNQKLPKAPSKDKKQNDQNQQDQDGQSQNTDLTALLLGAASTHRRKQGQDQAQAPDTQALTQDGAQMGQSLPGDITNTVSDGVNLGQSAGSAAQSFGSAAADGASLASAAQSGAVNPMDAVSLVQDVSSGVSSTADAVNSGTSIASTWLGEAGQGAQFAADANPQLQPQMQQVQQLTKAAGQVSDLTGQVASGVSHVSGAVDTASSLGASGMPDASGASDLLSEGGSAQAMSGGSALGSHLAQAPMEPPTPSPTPPNYPEVPRTITPTPSSSPAPSASPIPEPHLAPPVTAPGPTPEPPPTTSSTATPTPTTNPPTPSSTTETSPTPPSTTPPPPAPGQWEPIDLKDVTYVKDPNVATGQEAARGYINQALDKMGITDPAARENWMNGYLTMSYRESTWNPNAINTYDSNAQASTYTVADGEGNQDSRGLVQAIPTTFAGYHQSGTSNNIYDPVASVAASMNYVMNFPAYGVSRDGSDLAQIIQQANPNKGPKGY